MLTSEDYIEMFKQWGEDRGIPEHSTALAQSRKTIEEVHELITAATKLDMLDKGIIHSMSEPDLVDDIETELADAIGDVIVTLVQVAQCAGLNVNTCFEQAWNDIKDRKGAFGPDGTWVKES